MDSSGTWMLAKEISGPFRGLPCWNKTGWKRGLPDPVVQLLGYGTVGTPGVVSGNPVEDVGGEEVTAGSAASTWNMEAAVFTWDEGLKWRGHRSHAPEGATRASSPAATTAGPRQ